jgi:hypothetical protein
LSILESSNRVFLATPFLALEVVPKAAFNRQQLELLFYERYMASATTYRGLNQIEKVARTEAARCGRYGRLACGRSVPPERGRACYD